MSAPARVEVTLLGQALTLRTTASPEYMKRLVAFVEDRVALIERGGVRDRSTALALAAVDIADELHRARDDRARGADDVRARLDALVGLLEAANSGDRQSP